MNILTTPSGAFAHANRAANIILSQGMAYLISSVLHYSYGSYGLMARELYSCNWELGSELSKLAYYRRRPVRNTFEFGGRVGGSPDGKQSPVSFEFVKWSVGAGFRNRWAMAIMERNYTDTLTVSQGNT